MRHLALTGNIAAGKSSVAARLAAKGATVIDADQLAREAVAPGTPGFEAVVDHFGPAIVAPDGGIDRSALRRRVFGDAAARDVLNGIIHPIVARLRDAAVRDARARGATLIISDIPLLFEVGLERAFDGVLLVDAPEAVRRDRLMRNRALTAAEADAMIAAQWPSARKRAGATWILDNTGTSEELARQVDALWPALQSADPPGPPLPYGASAADTSSR